MARKGSSKGAPPGPPPSISGPGRRASAGLSHVKTKIAGDSLQEAAAALKRVEVADGRAQAAPIALESAESFKEYQEYVQCFNIERWLAALGELTFPTIFIALSREEAQAMIDANVHNETRNPQARTELEDAVHRLENVMRQYPGGCMVKTSSRSAKDSPDPVALRRQLDDLLSQLGTDENAALLALSYASMALLRMRSADEVMDIFLKSERIWHDMHLALAQDHWDESLACRAWVDLEPDMEFRCFVAGGRLTCASQYRHLNHFPRLLALRAILEPQLRVFLEDLMPRLAGLFPRDNYIVDVAVELHSASASNILQPSAAGVELGRWWCIEVNPFFETTDGCLFSWRRDQDLLEGRCSSFELRLQERPSRGALSTVYGAWREAIQECMKKG